jgi:hypothetical protein
LVDQCCLCVYFSRTLRRAFVQLMYDSPSSREAPVWCPSLEVKTVFPVDTYLFFPSENKNFLSWWQGWGRKGGKRVKTIFFGKIFLW